VGHSDRDAVDLRLWDAMREANRQAVWAVGSPTGRGSGPQWNTCTDAGRRRRVAATSNEQVSDRTVETRTKGPRRAGGTRVCRQRVAAVAEGNPTTAGNLQPAWSRGNSARFFSEQRDSKRIPRRASIRVRLRGAFANNRSSSATIESVRTIFFNWMHLWTLNKIRGQKRSGQGRDATRHEAM
jgi:hypothetical protein